jgi:programmed cell death protein 4
MIACFLARAVVDEVLPPAFLSNENNNRPGCLVIEKAIGLLNREHSTARLERIWGPGDGRSVDELKAEMKHLLQEYLLSRELDEAARCVRELECSYFHHELVKRGAVTAMELEGSAEENLDAMAALFGFLVGNAIVSEHQVQKGLSRLRASLPDVALDVPAAPRLLDLFEDMLAHSLSKAKEQLDVDR